MFDDSSSPNELADEIVRAARALDCGTARLVKLIAVFDSCEGWTAWGSLSCAQWLAWRCGMSPGVAREHVRVARALTGLPLISKLFDDGSLSYSKVRALTRIASKENEELLVSWARRTAAADLELIVQGHRLAHATTDPALRRRRRSVRSFYDDEGMLVITARLEPEVGVMVLRAIEEAGASQSEAGASQSEAGASQSEGGALPAGAGDASAPHVSAATAEAEERLDHASPHPEGELDLPDPGIDLEAAHPAERRRADGLAALADHFLATRALTDDTTNRAMIVLHVSREGRTWRAQLDNGPPVHPSVARRLACDGTIMTVEDGAAMTVGRRTRVVPRRIRRALRARDNGCRFPSCRARRVHAHHIKHWADGGETSLANLVELCERHHRLVHEGGFTVTLHGGSLVFARPDGTAMGEVIEPATATA